MPRSPQRWLSLADLFAIARELKGWSLRELETRAGVSNALLSQIETGKVKEPGFATVVRICDALGVPLERAAASVRPPLSALRTEAQPFPPQHFCQTCGVEGYAGCGRADCANSMISVSE